MKTYLVLESGKRKGVEQTLADGVYLVGRAKQCQIRPKNKKVSRKHCAIINRRRTVEVQDIGSKTGTYINGQRIELNVPVQVANGDRLQIGNTRFQFKIDSQTLRSKRRRRQQCVAVPPAEAGNNGDDYLGDPIDRQDQTEPASRQLQAVAADMPTANTELPADSARATIRSAPRAPVIDPSAEDILQLLEDDKDEAGNQDLIFADPAEQSALDLDAESDSDVEFLAPASGESIGENDVVPSYQLRQDWDVQSVHKWVASGKTAAPTKSAMANGREPAFAKKRPKPQPKSDFLTSLDGDLAKPLGILLAFALFGAWIAYNIYLLVTFKG